jgi:hypothetical protein
MAASPLCRYLIQRPKRDVLRVGLVVQLTYSRIEKPFVLVVLPCTFRLVVFSLLSSARIQSDVPCSRIPFSELAISYSVLPY